MRRIVECNDVQNRNFKDNLHIFHQQQIAFNKQSLKEYSWQIVVINKKLTGTDITLRDIIADIKTEKGNPIIHFIKRA